MLSGNVTGGEVEAKSANVRDYKCPFSQWRRYTYASLDT